MGSEHYCLRWNNHQSNLLGVFSQLLESESLVDVTLACTEGPSIRAHKVVLSACSSYFQTLFLDHPNRHPIVILKDVRFSELRTLVDFMYKGEVNVEYCQLSALLKTAESLKVKGLADMTNINAAVATRDEQQHHHHHQHQQHHQHHQQQQQHHHHNNDTPRETRNDTMRERDKEHRIDKEYNDKDNIKDELKLQNSHKEHIQQNKHNSLINQHINDNSEAVDMTECPLTPKREIDSSPERPLALDRPRRDSDDAASLDDTRASISPVSVHSGPSDMSLTNNTTITTAATTTTTAATTTTTTSSSSSSSSSLSNNNNNNNSTNTTTTSTTTTTTTTPPTPTTTPGALSQSRLPSPHSTEPLAGPSGLPPVQQVPLSLKKEMDWDRSSDERCASSELSTDYRLPPDPVSLYSMSLALGLDAGGWGALVERASATGSPLLGQHGSSSSLGVAGLASLARRCTVCLATFPSAWLLERHALLQHAGQSKEEKPFTCEQCGQRYRYRSAYVKHREQNHRARLPADKLFTCDVCGMQFRYLKSFKKHRLNHALERLQRGPENLASGISILTERAERSDQVSSTGEPSQLETGSEAASPSATGVSGGAGGGVDDIAKDSTETGDINSETTSEQHDNNQDITEQAIDLHTGRNNVNSNDQLNNINTDINNITTERVLSIVKAHHDTEKRERRFACPFCGKCVRSKENLKLHVRKHTGERPFVCLFCGRAFGGKSDLTRHLRIHTGERPYHCEMCGKCFARADYLSKHLTTHIHQR